MREASEVWDILVGHLLEASEESMPAEEVTPKTRLKEDLGLGSLQAITLVMDLEEAYGMQVDDEELESLVTVGDLLELIEAKLEDGGSESPS